MLPKTTETLIAVDDPAVQLMFCGLCSQFRKDCFHVRLKDRFDNWTAVGTYHTLAHSSITTLYNTGVDALGNPLPAGTVGDPHHALSAVPGGTAALRVRTASGGFPIPPYLPDNTVSAWIGPNNENWLQGPVGVFLYRTVFDLSGMDPNSARITGQWSTDNEGLDILINGSSLGFSTAETAFEASFFPFKVESGFLTGVNELRFVVQNLDGPSALRVEMTGTANYLSTPEPATGLRLAAGFAALISLRGHHCFRLRK